MMGKPKQMSPHSGRPSVPGLRSLLHMQSGTTRTHRWRHRFLAHTSRAVYGTIVATAVIAGTNVAIADWDSGEFLATLIVTLVVLWFAEIYSEVLGDMGSGSLWRRIRRAAAEHGPVLEPVVPLGIPLLLGTVGVIDEATAVLLTLVVAVLALATWGGIAARQRGASGLMTTGAAITSALLGVIIIILKTFH